MASSLGIPRILLNDDVVSIKTRADSNLDFDQPVDSSSVTENIFNYDFTPKSENRNSQVKRLNSYDSCVPIPDCFLHSTTISDEDFSHLEKKSKIRIQK